MTGNDLETAVAKFPHYPEYEAALATIADAEEGRPAAVNTDSLADLRGQLAYVEARDAAVAPVRWLHADIAESSIPTPFKIGLLAAIGVPKPKPKQKLPRSMALFLHGTPETNDDLPIEAFAWPDTNPYRQAVKIGGAIIEVANVLTNRRNEPFIKLWVGRRRSDHSYPTEYACFRTRDEGLVIPEPVVVFAQNTAPPEVAWDFPRLKAIKTNTKFEPKDSWDAETTVTIPKIDQLRGADKDMSALKFGRKALAFVRKEQRRREAAARQKEAARSRRRARRRS